MSSYAVDAKKDAEDSANVLRQHCSALPFATVVDYVHTTDILIHWNTSMDVLHVEDIEQTST